MDSVNQASQQLAYAEEQQESLTGKRDGTLDALKKLGELRDLGVLTDPEFETEKAQLLAEI